MLQYKNRHGTFALLTFIVLAGMFLPMIFQKGMFLDGITYGAISNNLSQGIGTPWNPHYTKTLYPEFHEHPPLVFIIQSLFFTVFGSSYLTERIFCFFPLILTTLLIILIFKTVIDDKKNSHQCWIPILIWISVPIVTWTFRNNLLENTMSVFSISSVYCSLVAIKKERYFMLLPAGLFIVMAFLSKGFTGIFPLAVPLLYMIVYKKYKQSIVQFLVLCGTTALCIFFLYAAFPEFKINILAYFDRQLLPALAIERDSVSRGRFRILKDLIFQLIIPIMVMAFFVVKEYISKNKVRLLKNRKAFLMLLIGLSASVPLIVTYKQRMFYLTPSIPFFALAISLFLRYDIEAIITKISNKGMKLIRAFSLLAFMVILAYTALTFGTYARDREKLEDVHQLSSYLLKGTIIGSTKNLWTDYKFVAYMSRIGYLSLDFKEERDYYILSKDEDQSAEFYHLYKDTELELHNYTLFKRAQ